VTSRSGSPHLTVSGSSVSLSAVLRRSGRVEWLIMSIPGIRYRSAPAAGRQVVGKEGVASGSWGE
jgi:hypothetical protein